MSAVGITENAKGDNKKFEIWCNSREEVYIVQAMTPEIKTAWVNEIRKVLTGQLQAYREASQQRATDQVFQFPAANPPPKNTKKGDEKKIEPGSPEPTSSSSPKNQDKGKDTGPHITLTRAPGKYTVVADYEKGGAQDLAVKSGDMVQLIKEGDDGQWFVRNLKTSKEGWVPAANLLTLIGESKSSQSLTSSEGSGSGNLSTSSSCSETYASFSDIKA
ncbi:hypothetical protein JZ751_023607 [Albula glossodonta]|uniref:Uncharacterized protein n=1 Tax=Albula glossodonta TaxID=121402 RepID=A0A8T2NGT0_9TELE|nr:hypothetical protein JZ751_023607 [Albula glossodonta]